MEIKGLPSSSNILRERQEVAIDGVKGKFVDELMEKARGVILKLMKEDIGETEINEKIHTFINSEMPGMTYMQRQDITREIMDELKGYGPIADLINEPEVSDIVVVNAGRVVYEKKGDVFTYTRKNTPVTFRSTTHLRLLIEKLCMLGYSRIDESEPISVFNAEGMRVTLSIPPVSTEPTIAIRKFVAVPTLEELINTGNLSPQAAEFLKACAIGRRNLAFAGGMGTGKTTMIAILARYFDEKELPILVEMVRECPMEHPNLRILVARPPNIEGRGEIKMDKLIRTALTMKGTRVLVSEAKGAELFDVLQAMNIGHDGSMFTFHANNSVDAIYKRLPSMLMMSKELNESYNPYQLIGNSIHFLCMLEQVNGKRQVSEISEITYSYEKQKCQVNPVFKRENGILAPTGYVPDENIENMRRWYDMPKSIFTRS